MPRSSQYEQVPVRNNVSSSRSSVDVQMASLSDSNNSRSTRPTRLDRASLKHRYQIITTACRQLTQHARLPIIMKRARSIWQGYLIKIDEFDSERPFSALVLANLSRVIVNQEEETDVSVTLLDYLVRQTYRLDFANDAFAQQPSSPSLLCALSFLEQAARVRWSTLCQQSSELPELHRTTEQLILAVLHGLLYQDAADSIAALKARSPSVDDLFLHLHRFVLAFRASEIKIGVKNRDEMEEEDVEVDTVSGWTEEVEQRDEHGRIVDDEETETMDIQSFLGQSEASVIAPDDEEVELDLNDFELSNNKSST